jgi:hypothetical protein
VYLKLKLVDQLCALKIRKYSMQLEFSWIGGMSHGIDLGLAKLGFSMLGLNKDD